MWEPQLLQLLRMKRGDKGAWLRASSVQWPGRRLIRPSKTLPWMASQILASASATSTCRATVPNLLCEDQRLWVCAVNDASLISRVPTSADTSERAAHCLPKHAQLHRTAATDCLYLLLET